MKPKVVAMMGKWSIGAAITAGLIYSVVTLMLTTKPAYASSCDCVEAQQDAEELCRIEGHGNAGLFVCPYGPDNNAYVQCTGGYVIVFPCSF
jgi:hypothetical protein